MLDEPTAVADLLQLDDNAGWWISAAAPPGSPSLNGQVTYSADEATGGGHHISLTLAGNRGIGLEEAERYKRCSGRSGRWLSRCTRSLAEIVARHIAGQGIVDCGWQASACMQPGA